MLTTIVCWVALTHGNGGDLTGSRQRLSFPLTRGQVRTLYRNLVSTGPTDGDLDMNDPHEIQSFHAIACENVQDLVEVVNGQ